LVTSEINDDRSIDEINNKIPTIDKMKWYTCFWLSSVLELDLSKSMVGDRQPQDCPPSAVTHSLAVYIIN